MSADLFSHGSAQQPIPVIFPLICIKLYGTRGDETQSTINIHQSNQHIWYNVHGWGT